MFDVLRRLGVLSLCCFPLISGPLMAKQSALLPYEQHETQSGSALVSSLANQAPGLDVRVLTAAVSAMECAVAGGVDPAERLAVIEQAPYTVEDPVVLVVSHNAALQRLIRLALQRAGFRVETVFE